MPPPGGTPDNANYDVLVVGGGPVGLLLAYQLKRFGVSVCVLEQHEKEMQDAYGRAIALFPRTLEQLDQLDLIEPMLQLGFACRTSVTYKDGERVVWTFMENIQDTTYDFVLVLRQMYTEQILREKLDAVGARYYHGMKCVDFTYDENLPRANYPIVSTFVDGGSGEQYQLRSKYLVGADGGHSFVRRHAGISFEGDSSDDQWIRIDGIVETDMPLNRSYGAIESKTHGNVLWAPLDHAATRIGYAYTAEIAAKYPGGVTQEVAKQEAIEAMKPFKVNFKEVHWWTLYNIGQRLANSFSVRDRILLCGDAAHTHSSGAAQGLNTGIHDAVNLGWKLALQIRDATKLEVLKTYDTERMTAVQQLIRYDKDISTLMSHKWPSWYEGDRNADPYHVLGEIFEKTASFNTGLGICYSENFVNQTSALSLRVPPGSRPPDLELSTPGTDQKVRFQHITRNIAKFWVAVFTGNINATRTPLRQLRKAYAGMRALPIDAFVSWITISASTGCSPYEALGMEPFGNTYYDATSCAHERFGFSLERGGIAIIRPDGLLATGGPLDGQFVEEYFSKVMQ
ncbi:uncharacterized protein N7482_002950 [Penicillium canariense]|uniref:FAD-binding domain-containing protein n=1 Tax=Penicillium canariense TaxID=189055 RepID=A0A9W9II02_9EURO|nr:uncharacterized protein N7482_002950 [Penicillium canariense]KAJ5177073.1 hypothetical protein N7482_002950 [Penicillium canariense]